MSDLDNMENDGLEEDEGELVGYCSECDEPIYEGDEYHQTDNGQLLCESCYNDMFAECEMCGNVVSDDELVFLGDIRICPDCLEEQCPSFDEKQNKEETTEAYEAMLKRYIGRKSISFKGKTVDLSTGTSDSNVDYSLSVTVDENGIITDISRLSAEMLLSEGVKSSNWRPYAIDSDDYEYVVDNLMEELELEDSDDEGEDGE